MRAPSRLSSPNFTLHANALSSFLSPLACGSNQDGAAELLSVMREFDYASLATSQEDMDPTDEQFQGDMKLHMHHLRRLRALGVKRWPGDAPGRLGQRVLDPDNPTDRIIIMELFSSPPQPSLLPAQSDVETTDAEPEPDTPALAAAPASTPALTLAPPAAPTPPPAPPPLLLPWAPPPPAAQAPPPPQPSQQPTTAGSSAAVAPAVATAAAPRANDDERPTGARGGGRSGGGGGGGSSTAGRGKRTRGAAAASVAPAAPAAPAASAPPTPPAPAAEAGGGGGLAALAARLRAALDASPVDEAAASQALEALKGMPSPAKKEFRRTGLRDLLNRIDRARERELPFNVKALAEELSETWFPE